MRIVVPAGQVGEPDSDARPEQCVAAEHKLRVVIGCVFGAVHLSLQDDGHDNAIDGHGFAHDNA